MSETQDQHPRACPQPGYATVSAFRVLLVEADEGDAGEPGGDFVKRIARVYWHDDGRYELELWRGTGHFDGYPTAAEDIWNADEILHSDGIERHVHAYALADLLVLGLVEIQADDEFEGMEKWAMGEAIRQAVDVAGLKAATGDDCVEGPVVRLATSGD